MAVWLRTRWNYSDGILELQDTKTDESTGNEVKSYQIIKKSWEYKDKYSDD